MMGLATIDPHSQKEQTEIHKIPKFGVNQASFDWNPAIYAYLRFNFDARRASKLAKKCMAI